MNTKLLLRLFVGILAILSILSIPFTKSSAASTTQRVYDYAETYSDEEIQLLEQEAEDYYKKTGYNFFVITTTTREEYSYTETSDLDENCRLYSKAFYDTMKATNYDEYKNAAILVLDLSDNRYANVQGQGELESKLNSTRCNLVFDHIKDDLSDSYWYDATINYYKYTAKYIKYKPAVNPEAFYMKTWVQAIAAILIGALIILINILNAGGKMTVSSFTYLKNANMLAKHDHYIRTSVTKTKRSSDNDSSSSSSGGGSNGGGHF